MVKRAGRRSVGRHRGSAPPPAGGASAPHALCRSSISSIRRFKSLQIVGEARDGAGDRKLRNSKTILVFCRNDPRFSALTHLTVSGFRQTRRFRRSSARGLLRSLFQRLLWGRQKEDAFVSEASSFDQSCGIFIKRRGSDYSVPPPRALRRLGRACRPASTQATESSSLFSIDGSTGLSATIRVDPTRAGVQARRRAV